MSSAICFNLDESKIADKRNKVPFRNCQQFVNKRVKK